MNSERIVQFLDVIDDVNRKDQVLAVDQGTHLRVCHNLAARKSDIWLVFCCFDQIEVTHLLPIFYR